MRAAVVTASDRRRSVIARERGVGHVRARRAVVGAEYAKEYEAIEIVFRGAATVSTPAGDALSWRIASITERSPYNQLGIALVTDLHVPKYIVRA